MSDESVQPKQREKQFADPSRGARKSLIGRVLDNKMSKTISVQIERTEMHRKYGKYIRRHSKIYAHDEKGAAKPGDLVRVIEGRPTSKLKRFHLAEVLKAAHSEVQS